jgi:ribonuclease HI
MCKLGLGNALFAELKGILSALHIIREMQLTNIILETDSIHAINMIQNRYTSIFTSNLFSRRSYTLSTAQG